MLVSSENQALVVRSTVLLMLWQKLYFSPMIITQWNSLQIYRCYFYDPSVFIFIFTQGWTDNNDGIENDISRVRFIKFISLRVFEHKYLYLRLTLWTSLFTKPKENILENCSRSLIINKIESCEKHLSLNKPNTQERINRSTFEFSLTLLVLKIPGSFQDSNAGDIICEAWFSLCQYENGPT